MGSRDSGAASALFAAWAQTVVAATFAHHRRAPLGRSRSASVELRFEEVVEAKPARDVALRGRVASWRAHAATALAPPS
eukprot:2706877-Pyramimonas_sp.AAC.1